MEEKEKMTREEFLDMLLSDAYNGYADTTPNSKEEAIHHNRVMQVAKMVTELEENQAKRNHEKEILELKKAYEAEKFKNEERSKNIDRVIDVAKVAAGTGASIYGTSKMVKMFKTINEFEKSDIITSDSSKHLIKYIFSKDGLMGAITKIIRR